MSSPLRSCEEDEGMVVNSEGGDFDEDEDDDEDGGGGGVGGGGGEPDDGNASDINSPAAPRESATAVAPGTVRGKRGEKKWWWWWWVGAQVAPTRGDTQILRGTGEK